MVKSLCRKIVSVLKCFRSTKILILFLTVIISRLASSKIRDFSKIQGDQRLSLFTCTFLNPKLETSWYKPKTLSTPISQLDFHACKILTKGIPLSSQFFACRRNIEIFSSCTISNVQIFAPSTYPRGKVQLLIRAGETISSEDFVVPGLGLERRDFRSTVSKQKKDLKEWGDGAKRLELSVSREPLIFNKVLPGITYMVRAYHMNNLGHFYETIFRIFLEIKKRNDFER